MVPLVEGKIIFDEANIDDVPLQLLRSKISVVSQDVILFGGNIRWVNSNHGAFIFFIFIRLLFKNVLNFLQFSINSI